MSDLGRQSFTDKAESALKPESEKSTLERGMDTVKGNADSAASTLQPQHEKSTGQKVTDTVSGNQNDNHHSLADKAKDALGMNKH